MHLDRFTIRNLELIDAMSGEGKSLLDVIDKTVCPMGARRLRRWMLLPLLDVKEIKRRHDAVAAFVNDMNLRERGREAARLTGDMERLGGRVASGKITPGEMIQLAGGVAGSRNLHQVLLESDCGALHAIADTMADISGVERWIRSVIDSDAPNSFGKGKVIADGVDAEPTSRDAFAPTAMTHSSQFRRVK